MSIVALSFFLCYTLYMAVTKVADAKEDEEHWLEERMKYLSASDMFSWREIFTKETSWWPDRRADVIDKKMGIETVFDEESIVSMSHGSYDEENIIRKFGHAADCEVEAHNGMYVNDRWPMLSCSVDAFGRPWEANNLPGLDIHPELCQDPDQFQRLHDHIMEQDCDFILETKKSTSVKWQQKCPDYYVTQVQAQLAILEAPYAIIAAECIHKGDTQKWRLYWDFRCYLILPDPAWPAAMDQMNQEALDAFGHLC